MLTVLKGGKIEWTGPNADDPDTHVFPCENPGHPTCVLARFGKVATENWFEVAEPAAHYPCDGCGRALDAEGLCTSHDPPGCHVLVLPPDWVDEDDDPPTIEQIMEALQRAGKRAKREQERERREAGLAPRLVDDHPF